MPRKRRSTLSGDDAQNVGSVPGQRYGEGVEQQALQQALPAPNRDSMPQPGTANAPTPQAGPPAVVDQTVVPAPDMISEYLAQNNPTLLAGSSRPDEPVTAGLSTGPGPGRSIMPGLMQTAPMARYLNNLTNETGNPKWRMLAERAGL